MHSLAIALLCAVPQAIPGEETALQTFRSMMEAVHGKGYDLGTFKDRGIVSRRTSPDEGSAYMTIGSWDVVFSTPSGSLFWAYRSHRSERAADFSDAQLDARARAYFAGLPASRHPGFQLLAGHDAGGSQVTFVAQVFEHGILAEKGDITLNRYDGELVSIKCRPPSGTYPVSELAGHVTPEAAVQAALLKYYELYPIEGAADIIEHGLEWSVIPREPFNGKEDRGFGWNSDRLARRPLGDHAVTYAVSIGWQHFYVEAKSGQVLRAWGLDLGSGRGEAKPQPPASGKYFLKGTKGPLCWPAVCGAPKQFTGRRILLVSQEMRATLLEYDAKQSLLRLKSGADWRYYKPDKALVQQLKKG